MKNKTFLSPYEVNNPKFTKKYCIINEILNSFTHFIGFVLSIIGSIFLISKAHSKTEFVSFLIYSLSMILLYLFSTIYHSFFFTKFKNILQRFDHLSIFILIAASYTPFCLLKNYRISISILVAEWIIALIGIIMKIFYFKKTEKYSLFLYLFMGWLGIFMFPHINDIISKKSIIFLLFGGISYTLGSVFFALEKFRYFHVIWHLFVLSGSLMIWLAVFYI